MGRVNPFHFMELQDVQELTDFFERRVSAHQVGVQGEVDFDRGVLILPPAFFRCRSGTGSGS